MSNQPWLQTRLRRLGISYTKPRELVFETLMRLGPCPKNVIISELRGQVDRATAYRALGLFVQSDIAFEVRPGVIEITDRFLQHHHHLKCTSCGREYRYHHEPLEKMLSRLSARYEFYTEHHIVELTGLCRECAAAAGKQGTGITPGQFRRNLYD